MIKKSHYLLFIIHFNSFLMKLTDKCSFRILFCGEYLKCFFQLVLLMVVFTWVPLFIENNCTFGSTVYWYHDTDYKVYLYVIVEKTGCVCFSVQWKKLVYCSNIYVYILFLSYVYLNICYFKRNRILVIFFKHTRNTVLLLNNTL